MKKQFGMLKLDLGHFSLGSRETRGRLFWGFLRARAHTHTGVLICVGWGGGEGMVAVSG